MKTKEKFPLTTFIKNVQSTLKKVVKFALNNVEYFLVATGIAAKTYETLIADFDMPLSFYTDMALDMLLAWGWIKYQMSYCKILRRRLATCALNYQCIYSPSASIIFSICEMVFSLLISPPLLFAIPAIVSLSPHTRK